MSQKNVIPDRIADALLRFPPFSMLPEEDVHALANAAVVRVVPAGDTVWKQGDAPGEATLGGATDGAGGVLAGRRRAMWEQPTAGRWATFLGRRRTTWRDGRRRRPD